MSPPRDPRLRAAQTAATERRLDDADLLLEELLAEAPDSLPALDLLGFVRFFQGRYAEAEAACRRCLELDPGRPYALKGLGLCLARQGQLAAGRAALEEAMVRKPGWFDPYWDLAVVLRDAGLPADALTVLARGRAAVPSRAADFDRFERGLRRALATESPRS